MREFTFSESLSQPVKSSWEVQCELRFRQNGDWQSKFSSLHKNLCHHIIFFLKERTPSFLKFRFD